MTTVAKESLQPETAHKIHLNTMCFSTEALAFPKCVTFGESWKMKTSKQAKKQTNNQTKTKTRHRVSAANNTMVASHVQTWPINKSTIASFVGVFKGKNTLSTYKWPLGFGLMKPSKWYHVFFSEVLIPTSFHDSRTTLHDLESGTRKGWNTHEPGEIGKIIPNRKESIKSSKWIYWN